MLTKQQMLWKATQYTILPLVNLGISLTKKNIWLYRKDLEGLAERMFEINPGFAVKVANNYLKTLPTKMYHRHKFEKKYRMKPVISAIINPGDYCQLACEGCATQQIIDRNKKVMSYSTMETIAAQLRAIGGRTIYDIGGESLHKKSKETVTRFIKEHKDMFFAVFTNGIELDHEFAKLVSDQANVALFLSCDGIGDVSEQTRGVNSFRHVEKAMGILQKERVPYGVSFTVRRNNYQHLSCKETIRYFESEGALALFYVPFIPSNGDREHMLSTEEKTTLNKNLSGITSKLAIFNYADLTSFRYCRAGTKHMYIDVNGDVSPCFTMGLRVGNIHNQKLEEILNSDFMKEYYQLKEKKGPTCLALSSATEILELAEKYSITQTNTILCNFAKPRILTSL